MRMKIIYGNCSQQNNSPHKTVHSISLKTCDCVTLRGNKEAADELSRRSWDGKIILNAQVSVCKRAAGGSEWRCKLKQRREWHGDMSPEWGCLQRWKKQGDRLSLGASKQNTSQQARWCGSHETPLDIRPTELSDSVGATFRPYCVVMETDSGGRELFWLGGSSEILEHLLLLSQDPQTSDSAHIWPNLAHLWTYKMLNSNHIESLQFWGSLQWKNCLTI